eukprot:scaffold65391_cov28-Tisochrysis_lutea.AAC.1
MRREPATITGGNKGPIAGAYSCAAYVRAAKTDSEHCHPCGESIGVRAFAKAGALETRPIKPPPCTRKFFLHRRETALPTLSNVTPQEIWQFLHPVGWYTKRKAMPRQQLLPRQSIVLRGCTERKDRHTAVKDRDHMARGVALALPSRHPAEQ